MIKIKYNGIKIKTDSIEEAVAILQSLKGTQPTYYPTYPPVQEEQGRWTAPDPGGWKITCSGGAFENDN